MDDAVTSLSASSPGFPTPVTSQPDEADPLSTPRPRLARGTSERTVAEVRAMLAASIALVPRPEIVIIAPRRSFTRSR